MIYEIFLDAEHEKRLALAKTFLPEIRRIIESYLYYDPMIVAKTRRQGVFHDFLLASGKDKAYHIPSYSLL
jgi:hypothetical protein